MSRNCRWFEFMICFSNPFYCVVPKHIHIPLHPKKEGFLKIPTGGWGFSKAKIFVSCLTCFDCSHDGFWHQLRDVFVEMINRTPTFWKTISHLMIHTTGLCYIHSVSIYTEHLPLHLCIILLACVLCHDFVVTCPWSVLYIHVCPFIMTHWVFMSLGCVHWKWEETVIC